MRAPTRCGSPSRGGPSPRWTSPPNAVALTRAAAERAGVEVTGIAAPFTEAELTPGSFDLVSAMYPVLERTDDQRAERRLAELVAPGGTLLFVHHEIDPARVHEGFDPTLFLDPAAVRASLGPGWEVVVDEARERHVAGGAGAGHTVDLVVRAGKR